MTTVQVAIPMLRGKRHFYVEKGRRWSVVEHLMLDVVAKRPSTAAELATKSDMPRRVVVEAFIRLMRVGWVELLAGEAGSTFAATEAGKAQLGSSELRAATTREDRWMSFAVDQVGGNVFRRREIYVHPASRVAQAPDSEALLYLDKVPRHAAEDLDAIYEALEGENEVIVGMEPTPDRLVDGFGVVTVKYGQIEGLPARASEELRAAILAKVAAFKLVKGDGKTGAAEPSIRRASARGKEIDGLFEHRDLLLDGAEHRAALINALRVATELVIVHSTFISPQGWKQILPAMIGAAARGTTVQVVWGQSDDQTETSSSRVEATALKAAIEEAERADKILVHPFTTGSHSKILVSDNGQGHWSAIVGSCNWLSTDFSSFESSIHLRDPRVVGEIINHIAMMSFAQDGIWHPTAATLTALGRRVAGMNIGPGRKARMRVLLAPDHADLVLQARDSAKRRILVASHRLGIAGKPMVIVPALSAARASKVACSLYYGRATGPLSGLDAAALTAQLDQSGVNVRPVHRPRLHAKVLAWDDDSLAVSSQNWLSADPSDSALRREIGILVEQNRLADTFIRRFEQAKAIAEN